MENGTDYRTLVKAYAIRFDVLVNGNVSLFLSVHQNISYQFIMVVKPFHAKAVSCKSPQKNLQWKSEKLISWANTHTTAEHGK